jgi:hypothetical protein
LLIWEIVFVLLILKLPVAYVCWVIWWAVKSEPELGLGGETGGGQLWTPWRHRRRGPRRPRNGPHGAPTRSATRTPPPARKATT